MKSFNLSFCRLISLNSDVSCHYLISRSGKTYNILNPEIKAWHAGYSEWKTYKNLNDYSIGIELENKGHEFGYTEFTKLQYNSLNKLLNSLCLRFNIKPIDILGHSDISPNRKKDPGELFKWNLINPNKCSKNKNFPISINVMLKKYGFSANYIKKFRSYCILAVKRKLGYKVINDSINKNFINDFKDLIN
tara:strand:+ start:221 stop:793 length:573 start_codon:yes stop_codon:yes gene_type:complete